MSTPKFQTIYPSVLVLGLGYKHARLLAMLSSYKKFHMNYYAKVLRVSPRTAYRALDDLKEHELVEHDGNKWCTNIKMYQALWESQKKTHGYAYKMKLPAHVCESPVLTDKAKLILTDMVSLASYNGLQNESQPFITLDNTALSERYKCSISAIKSWFADLCSLGLMARENLANGIRVIVFAWELFEIEVQEESNAYTKPNEKDIEKFFEHIKSLPDNTNDDIHEDGYYDYYCESYDMTLLT